jgi:hypothetical protein
MVDTFSMTQALRKTALAALANGKRLNEEVEYLRYEEPPTTAHFLVMLAQEELAKAFLLGLVYRKIIPWSKHILRASRDHHCKQLLGVVMEFLNPEWEEFRRRCDIVVVHKQTRTVPKKISDALNILRYEKIGRWESNSWVWAEDPEWDSEALAVAEGAVDKFKQDLIYVRLGRDGSLAHMPEACKLANLFEKQDSTRRMAEIADALITDEKHVGLDWDKVEDMLRFLFTEKTANG